MSNDPLYWQKEDAKAMSRPWPGTPDTSVLESINRYDVPQGFTYLDGLRGYFFITRPDCNIFNRKSLLLNAQATKHLGFNEFAGTSRGADPMNIYIAKMLMRNTGYPGAFMAPFTNKIKTYTPEDQRMDSIDHGETYYGQSIKYAKHAGQSRKAGSISITFEDYHQLIMYKLCCLWTEYAEAVFLGDMEPSPEYIWNNEIDYAATSFFIATRNVPDIVKDSAGVKKEGFEVVYWEKLTGIYPVSRPDSGFAFTKGQFINPEFTVQFDYSLKSKSSILDPYVLSEFNDMNKWNRKNSIKTMNSWDYDSNGVGTPGDYHVSSLNIFKYKGKFFSEWL